VPQGRFTGAIFSPENVEPWTPDIITGQGFSCSRGEFRTFWTGARMKRDVKTHMCRCFILRHQTHLAGYITLLADKLTAEEARRNLQAQEEITYSTFPAVKIGLLAADRRAKGAGTCLVEWAIEYVATEISPNVGVRFLTVDALYDVDTGYDISGFYQNFGFRFANEEEPLPPRDPFRTLYFDLLPLIP
jgi:GNAT superfamily N-acetyltransferase